jgi:hypothetical protein
MAGYIEPMKGVELTVMNWRDDKTGEVLENIEHATPIITKRASMYGIKSIEINREESKYDYFISFMEDHPQMYDMVVLASCSNLSQLQLNRSHQDIPHFAKTFKSYLKPQTKILVMWLDNFIPVEEFVPSQYKNDESYYQLISEWNSEFELRDDLDFPFYVPILRTTFGRAKKTRKIVRKSARKSRKSRKSARKNVKKSVRNRISSPAFAFRKSTHKCFRCGKKYMTISRPFGVVKKSDRVCRPRPII